MSKISTKQLFDEFYSDFDEKKAKKVRPQVDRPEVYAYEEKIGKQLIEMNVDELFEMMLSFKNNSRTNKTGYVINYNSFAQISSEYRKIFNYYIDHYEVIRNPWNDSRMRGINATERLAKDKKPYTIDDVEYAIKCIRDEYDEPRANYLEAIILMFYCGFSKAEEIVGMKESDINFKNKTIMLSGRTVRMNDRCAELLQYVHSMDSIEGRRQVFAMIPWNNSYFKFTVVKRRVGQFDNTPIALVANTLNRALINMVKDKFQIEISSRMLYLLGFYDSLVSKFGKDRAQHMITSVRDRQSANDLMNYASYYGIATDNVSHLKRMLRPFIDASCYEE